jgi:hypothetical protein
LITAPYSASLRYNGGRQAVSETARPGVSNVGETALVAGIRERFVQVADIAQPRRARAVAGLLTSFELERSSQRVRILDSDGSVYEGRWLAPMETERALFKQARDQQELSRKPQADERLLREKSDLGPVVFRLTGTNRNSKQSVLIEALVEEAGEPAAAGATAVPPAAPAPTARASALSPITKAKSANVRLVGHARMGTNELEINAVRVAPE